MKNFTAFIFSIATVAAVLNAGQRYAVRAASRSLQESAFYLLYSDLAFWYLWAISTFVILALARNYPWKTGSRPAATAVHLAAALIIGALHILLHGMLQWFYLGGNLSEILQSNLVYKSFMRTFYYALIAVGIYSYLSYRTYREEMVRLALLNSQLATANLQSLRMQLNPEFVSATLRSISDRLKTDIDTADILTARLGDFLRLSLEYPDTELVRLGLEIEYLQAYLEIERLRGDDPFRIEMKIDSAARECPVPNLFLYQMAGKIIARPGGLFSLNASVSEERLRIRVVTGAGIKSQDFAEVRNKLIPFYGEDVRLENDASSLLLEVSVSPHQANNSGRFPDNEPEDRVLIPEVEFEEKEPEKIHWPAIVGLWTVIAAFFFTREMLSLAILGQPLEWVKQLKDYVAWYWWVPFTPVVFALARQYPVRGSVWLKNSIRHCVAGVAIAVIMVFLYIGQRWAFGLLENDILSELGLLRQYPYVFDLMTYWAILGVGEATRYHRRYLKGELRAERLKQLLAQTQVEVLKMQLQPHFLFNTLNSVAELMHEDVDAAGAMIERLENFLRKISESEGAQEVSLEAEIESLNNYLAIQQIRFQDRLLVDLKIDPGTRNDRVPNLILQPIVENAIRYAVAQRSDPGKIEIDSQRSNGVLRLQIRDDGPGFPAPGSGKRVREGLGIANTRARLEQLYGSAGDLQIRNDPRGGLLVTIDIPQKEV